MLASKARAGRVSQWFRVPRLSTGFVGAPPAGFVLPPTGFVKPPAGFVALSGVLSVGLMSHVMVPAVGLMMPTRVPAGGTMAAQTGF